MLKMCIVVQCVQVCPDCTDLYTSMETVVSVAEKGCFADVSGNNPSMKKRKITQRLLKRMNFIASNHNTNSK